MEVAEHIDELGLRAAVISFAEPASLERFARERGLPFAYFADPPGRAAYAAFGFGRASVRRVWLDPRVWGVYAKLMLRGRRLRSAQDDTLQLGGDVVTGSDGRIRWIRRSRGPEDRPSVQEIASSS